jgi:hypothetical protein
MPYAPQGVKGIDDDDECQSYFLRLYIFLETCCNRLQGATTLRRELPAVRNISFFVIMIAKLMCGVPWDTVYTCFVC